MNTRFIRLSGRRRGTPPLFITSCLLLFTFYFLLVPSAHAFDFGLGLRQTAGYANTSGDGNAAYLDYTGTYTPWFTLDLGRTARTYLSAQVSTVYNGERWTPANPAVLPELERFEIEWRPASALYVEAGRLSFQDPLGIVAAGLFDGVGAGVVLGAARVSIGAYYTGFLYKESARVLMTPGDRAAYLDPFDYADMGTYFASRRVLASLTAEFADLTPRSSLTVNALAQFDVNPAGGNDSDDAGRLHTQYLTARYTFQPLTALTLSAAAVGGLVENCGAGAAYAAANTTGYTRGQFAAAAGADWQVPGDLRDLLHGEVRWASGALNTNVAAFAPVTAAAQGQVFRPLLSGLVTASGTYTARLYPSVSASAAGTYFIRTDAETLAGEEYPPSAARLLGGELYGTVTWAPASDLTVTAGGGAFFPGLGDAFASNAAVRWKVSAGFSFSL
jgi:hypothetical protein